MALEIVMPRLSDSMEEGTIVQWLVRPGDNVDEGQPVAEVETDKATVVYEAQTAGVVLELRASEGDSVRVGAPIALLGEPGESVEVGVQGAPRPKASPLARRIAAERGVDLSVIAGSGPQGRVTRADVDAAAPAAAPAAVNGAKGGSTVHELSRSQQTIARRMAESRATVPDIELRAEVQAHELAGLRERLREVTDPSPSLNDFIVKASALALRAFPRVNAAYRDGAVETFERVNVGVAVAAKETLLVPTIFDADSKPVAEIARVARTLAARARDGSITPAELSGATFTVSNLGMFGIDSFSAVINPPQSAILAVGAMRRRAVVDEPSGEIVARPTLQLTLACDHRVLYGADGARFLTYVRELLERPLSLLV
ncbi:MAG TPA: dihydrolipoamide acetyltransferase family protein [Solirubrobacteraceae bacterium]|nr:dihydrolipoamide acetyltransferase family protein [Solirubrobacteraceae bacterium]